VPGHGDRPLGEDRGRRRRADAEQPEDEGDHADGHGDPTEAGRERGHFDWRLAQGHEIADFESGLGGSSGVEVYHGADDPLVGSTRAVDRDTG
jgi:hypothetical protein